MIYKTLIGLLIFMGIWVISYFLGVQSFLGWFILLSFFALPFVFGISGIWRAGEQRRWLIIVWIGILLVVATVFATFTISQFIVAEKVECNFLTGMRDSGEQCTGNEVTGVLMMIQLLIFPIFVVLSILSGITLFFVRKRFGEVKG